MRLCNLAIAAIGLSIVFAAVAWGQAGYVRHRPSYGPNGRAIYKARPVSYTLSGNLVYLNPDANLTYDTSWYATGPSHACGQPSNCGGCSSCSTHVCKLCLPNLLPSIIRDLDCACDRMFDCLLKCAPQKICIPVLPLFPSSQCSSPRRYYQAAGCDSPFSHGAYLPTESYSIPNTIPDDNPFQDEPDVPPLPPPTEASGGIPGTLPHYLDQAITFPHSP